MHDSDIHLLAGKTSIITLYISFISAMLHDGTTRLTTIYWTCQYLKTICFLNYCIFTWGERDLKAIF